MRRLDTLADGLGDPRPARRRRGRERRGTARRRLPARRPAPRRRVGRERVHRHRVPAPFLSPLRHVPKLLPADGAGRSAPAPRDQRSRQRCMMVRVTSSSADERGPAFMPQVGQHSAVGLAAAYRICRQIATAHYENFTVGSWLLPRRMRNPIAAIYAFARTADDFADEGEVPAAERLARLAIWQEHLEACYAGRSTDPVFIALADTVARFEIPIVPFRRLLEAFRQDVAFQPLGTFAELRAYCRLSADPVGHLVLALFGYRDAERRALADQICTGLQLANFWQDVSR